jgi:hypothetical protein
LRSRPSPYIDDVVARLIAHRKSQLLPRLGKLSIKLVAAELGVASVAADEIYQPAQ